jgi:hypothetical protein
MSCSSVATFSQPDDSAFVESRLSGQGLHSNPEGLALSDQMRRHTIFYPAGKMLVLVECVSRVSAVALNGMQVCYMERSTLCCILWDTSLLNNWSCSLIHRACRSNGDSGDSTVSVAMASVIMCSMPSKSVRINCSSSSKDTYTAIFLESQYGQKCALSYRNIRLPQV